MKRFFKNKQTKKLPTAPEPRALEEIQKEFQELTTRAGNSQYIVYAHSQELEQLNKRLVEVNQEAALRQEIDKKLAAIPKKEEQEQPSVNP